MNDPKTLEPGLHLVSTPIGNLRDIGLRALDVLRSADVIYCEDRRVTGKFLKAYDIKVPLRTYNDHSDTAVREDVVSRIQKGQAVALVSDAGTPLISDPGYKLVTACRAAGVMVTAVPGANAILTAVQLSGMGSDAFSFIGFLPSKSVARQAVLARWREVPGALVAFETAPRLVKALADIRDILGRRDVAVVREMTKMYEEVRRGNVSDMLAYYDAQGAPKGEIVLVIAPGQEQVFSHEDVTAMVREALGEGMHTKEVARTVAQKCGWSVSDVYEVAVDARTR